jgi:hypothetical protein
LGPFFVAPDLFSYYNLHMLGIFWSLCVLLFLAPGYGATIAIIDTGFDLDHEFLKPKILKKETDEEVVDPELQKKFHGWKFHDNSHLKKPVATDTELQEILLFRSLKAKGHSEGLSPEEFEWFSRRNADKAFQEKVRLFKKHAHGTFVAGIALREGENINIFPIRGLHIPVPVVAVEDSETQAQAPNKGRTPQEKFNLEINQSLDRISKKFSKICSYLAQKNIQVVNASYGITYKNIVTKFREAYRSHTGTEIDETRLQNFVDMYFAELYKRGEKTIKRYPQMLFVFSAGNSGLDNDRFHHYPSKIRLPNTMSVAALNGEYLATFSNYGLKHVDIGAPGVGILSLVPKVYAKSGVEVYSPSSGTSMAAPYISNLAAQIMNSNTKLRPAEVKRIILETGTIKDHLKAKILSGSMADNGRALKAALLSRDLSLDEAINLARLNIIPMEDQISIGQPPARAAESMKKKMFESIPQMIKPEEVEDQEMPTISSSSSPEDPKKEQPDKLGPPASAAPAQKEKSADPVPASQSEEQSPPPSEERPASSSQSPPALPEAQSPVSAPSSPQS